MRERAVLLIGGNSEIGNAITRGICKRTGVDKIVRVSRNGSPPESLDTIVISHFTEMNLEEINERFELNAIVISFGVLKTEGDLLESLKENLEVNTIDYLAVCLKALAFLEKDNQVELHVTSSLLADFSRDSVFAYAASKSLMEKTFMYILRKIHLKASKIFLWKIAFVDTKLNAFRGRSAIFTTVKSIEKRVSRQSKPGVFYLPRIAKYPSRALGHFPKISLKFD